MWRCLLLISSAPVLTPVLPLPFPVQRLIDDEGELLFGVEMLLSALEICGVDNARWGGAWDHAGAKRGDGRGHSAVREGLLLSRRVENARCVASYA